MGARGSALRVPTRATCVVPSSVAPQEQPEEEQGRGGHVAQMVLEVLPKPDANVDEPAAVQRYPEPRCIERCTGPSFGQRLRKQARRSLLMRPRGPAKGTLRSRRSLRMTKEDQDAAEHDAPPQSLQGSPPRSRRRRRGLQWLPGDDDSSGEGDEVISALSHMSTNNPTTASRIRFTTEGIHLHVKGLEGCRDRGIALSPCVASVFASGVDPTSCVALQSGRLAPLAPPTDYQLQRSGDGWFLVADTRAFFNFELGRWQPLGLAKGPYGSVLELVYVAFVPDVNPGPATAGPALFVKLGYRELSEGEDGGHSGIIGYVEKKSRKLRLTNVPGAGIFIFCAPQSHQVFARPCRAAEASLKTELLHSSEVVVTLSGDRGDVGAFSSSLEYMFVEDSCRRGFRVGPLAALTRALRAFTGDATLLPQCSSASCGGGIRRGRKRLAPWPGTLEVSDAYPAATGGPEGLPVAGCMAASPTGAEPVAAAFPLRGPASALRSRAKRAGLGDQTPRKDLRRAALLRWSA